MDYTKDSEVKRLLGYLDDGEYDFSIDECDILSKYDYGSTYQRTDDYKSDKDMCYIYLTNLEDLLYKPKQRSKKVDECEARLIPLHEFYFLTKKYSVDSYLMLNAQLESGSKELNEKVFKDFYDKERYNTLVENHLSYTLKSVYGNLKNLKKNIDKKGLDGKTLVKVATFLGCLYKLERGGVDYQTLSKASDRVVKDVVPLKRKTVEELREHNFRELYFSNKGIEDYNDVLDYIELELSRCDKKITEYESDARYNGESYEDTLMEDLKTRITDLYYSRYKSKR